MRDSRRKLILDYYQSIYSESDTAVKAANGMIKRIEARQLTYRDFLRSCLQKADSQSSIQRRLRVALNVVTDTDIKFSSLRKVVFLSDIGSDRKGSSENSHSP